MVLELVKFDNVKLGLKELENAVYTLSQNLQARLDTPLLKDGTNLWQTWLDSRTIQLYDEINENQRQRFKIDHSFDLSTIVDANINQDGSVTIEPTKYSESQGTEFIVIAKGELNGADKDYAIRADKYNAISSALNESRNAKSKYDLTALMQAGGFALNSNLTPEEIITVEEKTGNLTRIHDGWLELAVGKNKGSAEDYSHAEDLLKKYVSEAQKKGCFKTGVGMGFYVETSSNKYKARSWFVNYSGDVSIASGRYRFDCSGRFLGVRRGSIAAEGGDALKIKPAFAEAYNNMLKGANVLHTPFGDYVLAKGNIADRQ